MREFDLLTGAAQLESAMEVLQAVAAESASVWNDTARRAFDEEFINPMEPRVGRGCWMCRAAAGRHAHRRGATAALSEHPMSEPLWRDGPWELLADLRRLIRQRARPRRRCSNSARGGKRRCSPLPGARG